MSFVVNRLLFGLGVFAIYRFTTSHSSNIPHVTLTKKVERVGLQILNEKN